MFDRSIDWQRREKYSGWQQPNQTPEETFHDSTFSACSDRSDALRSCQRNGNEPKHASFQVPFLKISCVANTVSLMSAQCSAVISLWSDVPLSMNDMGVPFHIVIASSQVPRTRIEEQYILFCSVLFCSIRTSFLPSRYSFESLLPEGVVGTWSPFVTA